MKTQDLKQWQWAFRSCSVFPHIGQEVYHSQEKKISVLLQRQYVNTFIYLAAMAYIHTQITSVDSPEHVSHTFIGLYIKSPGNSTVK